MFRKKNGSLLRRFPRVCVVSLFRSFLFARSSFLNAYSSDLGHLAL